MNDETKQTLWQSISRRSFLSRGAGLSLGAMALGLLERAQAAGGKPELPHFAPKAKNVIFLTQSGGPSQIELFDYKPGLVEWAGKELPDSVRQGQRLTTMTANQKQLIMPARTKFHRYGESGATIGEWLPHLGKVADELCFVKSMTTDQINHAPAMTKFLTGHQTSRQAVASASLDELRPGQRKQKPAGICCADLQA